MNSVTWVMGISAQATSGQLFAAYLSGLHLLSRQGIHDCQKDEQRNVSAAMCWQVPAVDYGLNILDILRAPEKELNQVVGMKRLAPYREDAGRFRPNMAKLREMQVRPVLSFVKQLS